MTRGRCGSLIHHYRVTFSFTTTSPVLPAHRRKLKPMPFVDSHHAQIHYSLEGPANNPALVFSNSLGTDFSMWDPQIRESLKSFRVLRYDARGHGESSVTKGPYSIEQLAKDVLAL